MTKTKYECEKCQQTLQLCEAYSCNGKFFCEYCFKYEYEQFLSPRQIELAKKQMQFLRDYEECLKLLDKIKSLTIKK